MTSQADSLDRLAAAQAGIHRGTRGFTGGGLPRDLRSVLPLLGILAAVSAISLLHYRTDVHSILLHEIFRRLYYVPIVVAAVVYGAIEILESEFPHSHPKAEFFEMARKEMQRLNSVVSEFLEFADPAPPATGTVNLKEVLDSASQLARSSISGRAVTIHVHESAAAPFALGDAEQIQRAVLNLILGATSELRDIHVDLHLLELAGRPAVMIRIPDAERVLTAADVFEPFPPSARAHGLALATARRLVENQHGRLHAETVAGALEFLMELPPASKTIEHSSHRAA